MSSQGKNSRLGKGLASLIGDANITPSPLLNASNVVDAKTPSPGEGFREIPIEMVFASKLNPRSDFPIAELEELTSSIRERGLVQPLIVRPAQGKSGYEIVAGERRWRAAQKAGLHIVPVIVRELDDKQLLELAVIENVQRSDLNAIEEAIGYRELIDRFGYRQDDLSKIVGKSRSHIANMLRLLKLPESVQSFVREGALTAGHARALIGTDSPEFLAGIVVERGLSVREVEELVHEQPGKQKEAPHYNVTLEENDPNILAVQKELSDALGLTVILRGGNTGSGELRIKYKTLEQFEAVRALLNGRR